MGSYADLLKAQNEKNPNGKPKTLAPRNQGTLESRNLGANIPRNQDSQETRNLGTQEAGKQDPAMGVASVAQDSLFDLNERAEKDATFQFAERELDALDMLCIELKRELGEKPKKYDIIRAGLQHMIEDYHEQRDNSILIKRLRKRK